MVRTALVMSIHRIRTSRTGPCQFPTLGFVVEQYERVQNFVAETFWHIAVALEREESNVEFSWKRNRLFDHQAAFILYELCVEEPLATVTDVQTKPASKWCARDPHCSSQSA
jgi:DNA topoisomerase-3